MTYNQQPCDGTTTEICSDVSVSDLETNPTSCVFFVAGTGCGIATSIGDNASLSTKSLWPMEQAADTALCVSIRSALCRIKINLQTFQIIK